MYSGLLLSLRGKNGNSHELYQQRIRVLRTNFGKPGISGQERLEILRQLAELYRMTGQERDARQTEIRIQILETGSSGPEMPQQRISTIREMLRGQMSQTERLAAFVELSQLYEILGEDDAVEETLEEINHIEAEIARELDSSG